MSADEHPYELPFHSCPRCGETMEPGFLYAPRGGWFLPKVGEHGPTIPFLESGLPLNPAVSQWTYLTKSSPPLDFRCRSCLIYWLNPKADPPPKVDEEPLPSERSDAS